jgi:hypothetical protein
MTTLTKIQIASRAQYLDMEPVNDPDFRPDLDTVQRLIFEGYLTIEILPYRGRATAFYMVTYKGNDAIASESTRVMKFRGIKSSQLYKARFYR